MQVANRLYVASCYNLVFQKIIVRFINCSCRWLPKIYHDFSLVFPSGRDIGFGNGKQRVKVRVTNRQQVPLTPDNLQSLSFSIPGLHTRLKVTVSDIGLFHFGNVQVYILPSAPPDKPGRNSEAPLPPSLATFYLSENVGEVACSEPDVATRFFSPGHWSSGQFEQTPTDSSPRYEYSSSEDFYTCQTSPDSFPSTWSTRWDSAISSPLQDSTTPCTTPTKEGQCDELISVDFKGRRFARLLSRIMCTDGDVDATWAVTDFTDCGELEFSLRLDFLRPRPSIPRWMEGITEEYW